jgi:hypothetical protein
LDVLVADVHLLNRPVVVGERGAADLLAELLVLLPDFAYEIVESVLDVVLCLGGSLDVLGTELGGESLSLCCKVLSANCPDPPKDNEVKTYPAPKQRALPSNRTCFRQ